MHITYIHAFFSRNFTWSKLILSSGIAGWAQSHFRETIWLILFPYLQLFYKFTNEHYASYTIALYVQVSMTQQVHNFVCWEKLDNIIQVTIHTTCRSKWVDCPISQDHSSLLYWKLPSFHPEQSRSNRLSITTWNSPLAECCACTVTQGVTTGKIN